MQIVAGVALLLIGLYVAVIADTSGDMRVFGWFLVGAGVLGLVSRALLPRRAGRHGRGRSGTRGDR
jgi:hypothetical protein